jgi:voltage-gated potassium channel
MSHPLPSPKITTAVGIATLIAAIALPIALSYEILRGDRTHFSPWYLNLQLAICVIFLLDFALRISATEKRWRFLWRNILFLLLSVPYLNLFDWLGALPSREWSLTLTAIPILRMLLALYLLLQWIIRDGIRQLFAAYALTLLLFTYISALIFYDFEFGINQALSSFGDAIWWAFMNMTTVGSTITPITAIGKSLAVLLPMFGMLMLPLFTVYISNIFQREQKERDSTQS